MDQLEQYRTIIKQVLTQRVNDLKDFPTLHNKTVLTAVLTATCFYAKAGTNRGACTRSSFI
jgi:hypothetical protein